MVSRENVVKSLSEEDRRWIARCQMIAVFLFLALVAGLVLWPVLPSVDGYAAATRSVEAGGQPQGGGEAAPAPQDQAEAP